MAKRVRTLRAFVEKIDFALLRKQRACVRAMAQATDNDRQRTALHGLTNLLDDLSDDAAALLGDKVVFGDGTNQGCLAGIKCPKCGNEDSFGIDASSQFTVTDDGTEDFHDVEWNGTSWVTCDKCEHGGEMWEFQA